MDELATDIVGAEDPLEEVAHSPVKNLIHNYPDRVAFCVTSECAIYCRFCLRKRMVGASEHMMRKSELRDALNYIRTHPEIRDVLLTGGDPLIFGDDQIDWLLGELRTIKHVEIIRIGTRMPVKLPFRITDALCNILKRHGPIWLNTHFNHPEELTPDVSDAVDRLFSAGVPVGNQSVLLRGINDSVATMRQLCNRLVQYRIRPYYLYQAQLIAGTAHLRTTIEEGMEIMESLQGSTTGFSIPSYVLDTPFGKVPLNRSYVIGRHGDLVLVRTTRGEIWAEPNPFESRSDASRTAGLLSLTETDISSPTYSLIDGKVSRIDRGA
jgi:lysine 2,3-aminomutase